MKNNKKILLLLLAYCGPLQSMSLLAFAHAKHLVESTQKSTSSTPQLPPSNPEFHMIWHTAMMPTLLKCVQNQSQTALEIQQDFLKTFSSKERVRLQQIPRTGSFAFMAQPYLFASEKLYSLCSQLNQTDPTKNPTKHEFLERKITEEATIILIEAAHDLITNQGYQPSSFQLDSQLTY